MKTYVKWISYSALMIVAVLLKYHYSTATPQQLRWILSPTAAAVGICQGDSYSWETGEGYVTKDKKTIIAPACAGINFLIIVFCITSFKLLPLSVSRREIIANLLFGMAASYIMTIIVNTVRITTASMLFRSSYTFLSGSTAHRIHGTLIFISMLFLYELFLRRLMPVKIKGGRKFVLLNYAVITLVIPICLGFVKGYSKDFPLHMITILCTACVITVLTEVFSRFYRKEA